MNPFDIATYFTTKYVKQVDAHFEIEKTNIQDPNACGTNYI